MEVGSADFAGGRPLIVVGLNGASRELIDRGVATGQLPAFARLRREGFGGEVWSLTTSGPAEWSAHLTGVSPRIGGVHGYLSRRRLYHGIGRARTEDLRVSTYPELLDEAGLSVGLVNLPPTYPPFELENGFCLSGMLTPVDETDYVHPPALAEELEDYEIGVLYDDVRYSDFGEPMYDLVREDQDLSLDVLRDDVLRVERRRLELTRRLLNKREPDLLAVLVSGLDVLQRFTWHEHKENSREKTAAMELYGLVDDFLGEVMDVHSDRPLLVFSGHGCKDEGSPQTSSSDRTVWSVLRGTLGPWLPDSIKQTGWYASLYDAVEGIVGGRVSSGEVEDRPSGLVQTGFPSRRGVWQLWLPSGNGGGELSLRFLDLSVLVMNLMGKSVPEAYEGSLPDRLLENLPDVSRKAIELEVDRGEPPPPNQQLQEKIRKEL